MFSGGLYLLAGQYTAVKQAASYANESILWDVSQTQRELLRLGLLLERAHPGPKAVAASALATQLDLAWSNLDRLEQGVSRAWIGPQSPLAQEVTRLRALFEQIDRLWQQFTEAPATYAEQALPHVTAAHTLANQIMSAVHQQHDANTTLLHATLHHFRQHLVGYAGGLALLIALLTSMTWRHLRSEQERRASEAHFRRLLQQAHDTLERRVEERTAALTAANASLQRAIAERQRTAREMLEISNREQRRIGQDLHDGLGQLLTGMALMSKALARQLATTAPAEAAAATQLVQLANQAITQTRELVRGLSPIESQNDSLLSALQNLAAQTESLFGITCRMSCDSPPPLQDPTVATHLYRIVQEAVSNAVKHGQAKHVLLTLTTGPYSTTLTVHDDGVGFSDTAERPPGLGLRIMHYRASMIGASLTLKSTPGSGTSVICTWPHTRTAC